VKLLFDKKLSEAKSLTFHPMQNDALTEISTEDFMKFLGAIGKAPTILDFEKLKKEAAAGDEEEKKEGKKEEKKAAAKKQDKKKKEGKKEEEETEEEYFCFSL